MDDDVPLGASPDDNGITDADLVDVETRMVVNKAGEVEAVEVRTLSGSLSPSSTGCAPTWTKCCWPCDGS